MDKEEIKDNKGVIAILALMAVSIFGLAVITSVSSMSTSALKEVESSTGTDQAFANAETGLNEGLYRLLLNPVAPSFNLDLNGDMVNDVTVEIKNLGFKRQIIAQGIDNKTNTQRKLSIETDTNTFAGGFQYAAFGGAGGVIMGKDSSIVAINAQSPAIHSNSTLTATDNGPTIIGQARYVKPPPDNRISVNGHTCPFSPDCEQTSDILDTPLSDPTDILRFTSPLTGIPPAPGVCPAAYAGWYCITTAISPLTLGGQTINNNVYVADNAVVNFIGSVFVTGRIVFDKHGSTQIDSSTPAGTSLVIIAHDTIDVSKNYDILGRAGDPNSFVLLISSTMDLTIKKGSNSLIVAAPHGVLTVGEEPAGSSVIVNAAAADTLHVMKNSVVQYNINIGSLVISPPSPNNVISTLSNWQEL